MHARYMQFFISSPPRGGREKMKSCGSLAEETFCLKSNNSDSGSRKRKWVDKQTAYTGRMGVSGVSEAFMSGAQMHLRVSSGCAGFLQQPKKHAD